LFGGIGFALSPGAWADSSTGHQLAAKPNSSDKMQPSLDMVMPPGMLAAKQHNAAEGAGCEDCMPRNAVMPASSAATAGSDG
jgi:hypothetical protein